MWLIVLAIVATACGKSTEQRIPLESAQALQDLAPLAQQPRGERAARLADRLAKPAADSITRYYSAIGASNVNIDAIAFVGETLFVVSTVSTKRGTFAAAGTLKRNHGRLEVVDLIGDPSGSPLDAVRPSPGSFGALILPVKNSGSAGVVGFVDARAALVQSTAAGNALYYSEEPGPGGAIALPVRVDGDIRMYQDDRLVTASSVSGRVTPSTSRLQPAAATVADDYLRSVLTGKTAVPAADVSVLPVVKGALHSLLRPWMSPQSGSAVDGVISGTTVRYELEADPGEISLRLYLKPEDDGWKIWGYALRLA